MPAGKGTGPLGWGPMTGRAAGYCDGFPGHVGPIGASGAARLGGLAVASDVAGAEAGGESHSGRRCATVTRVPGRA